MSKINTSCAEQSFFPVYSTKTDFKPETASPNFSYPSCYNNSKINNAITNSVSFGIKKIAKNKQELKNELSSMKTPNGELRFNANEIEQIINNENDVSELSKIINEIELNNLNLETKTYLRLLKKEGITLKLAKTNIDFYKDVLTKNEFQDIKKICRVNESKIFDFNKEEISNIRKNSDITKVIKKHFPEYYENTSKYNSFMILSILKDALISGETLENILNREIYPQKLQTDEIYKIVKNEIFNNIPEQNLKLLEDIKQNPKLGFFYSDPPRTSGLSNNAVTEILTKNLGENFNLNDKKEIIDFIHYLHSDMKMKIIMGTYNTGYKYAEILTRNSNDTFEEGKKLVEFIIKNNLIDADSSEYLTNNPFKDTLNIIERFEKNPLIDDYTCIRRYNIEDLNKYADIMDIAMEFSSLKDCKVDNLKILNDLKQYRDNNLSINIDIEKLKQELNNLDEYSKKVSPELWGKMKSKWLQNVIEKVVRNKSQTLNPQNVLYFNTLINNKKFNQFFDVQPDDILDFCNTKTDIVKLAYNQPKMFKFLENSSTYDNFKCNKTKLLAFEGDFDKLDKLTQQITKRYPSSQITMDTDKKNNVIFTIGDNKKIIYDKDMNFITKLLENTSARTNGITKYTQISEDKTRNQKHYIIKINDPVHDKKKTEKIITKYYDKNNNPVKIKSYAPSVIDGALDIKEIYPDGTVKNISSAQETEDGLCIEKHLTSPNGTKSSVYYKIENLKEELIYNIKDKNDNELCNLIRTSEITGENDKITSVNGKKYHVKYNENNVEIFDYTENKTEVIDLTEINPDNNEVLNDLLYLLSGDELIKLKNYVKELKLTNRIESKINIENKIMSVGPHKFIFEHELGHAKDFSADEKSKISSDKKLQEIFNREKTAFKENFCEDISKELNYFIKEEHYGGELGGLMEAVAEINAIQTAPKFHPLLQMRTQFLQEYFPETIAYLLNNYFA